MRSDSESFYLSFGIFNTRKLISILGFSLLWKFVCGRLDHLQISGSVGWLAWLIQKCYRIWIDYLIKLIISEVRDYPWIRNEEIVLLVLTSRYTISLSLSARNHHIPSVQFKASSLSHTQQRHTFILSFFHASVTDRQTIQTATSEIHCCVKELVFLPFHIPSRIYFHSQMRNSVILLTTRLQGLRSGASIAKASVPRGEVVPCAARWTGNGRAHRSWC